MKMMEDRIVFQEVPNEVYLLFQITGCKMRCKGCHSPELWNKENGTELTNEYFEQRLNDYEGLITCVLFFGGEWHSNELIDKIEIAKRKGLKTCLYTGENSVSREILEHLDFIKAGKWNEKLGGLDSITSNQAFIDLNTGEKLNYLFQTQTQDFAEVQYA